jgi:hypothetical protein
MPAASEAVDAAISEVTTARSLIAKIKTKQIHTVDALATLKSTAHAWFNSHRPIVIGAAVGVDLTDTDRSYTTILDSTAKHAARQTYLDALKETKDALIAVRAAILVAPLAAAAGSMDDLAPDFSPLAGNPQMLDILTRRWYECHRCVTAGAHLAAIVMMGGLLEALFVARANKMSDKSALINASEAPKDPKTGKTINYQQWMLDSYIRVAHELNWITDSAKNLADVLKEYRNYIHPEKELRHGVTLNLNDSSMFWQIAKGLVRQLLMSAVVPAP